MKKKVKKGKKWSVKSDMAFDKKHKIKEGSARDTAMDKKHGVLAKEEKMGIKHIKNPTAY